MTMTASWDGCSFRWLLLGMAAPWMTGSWDGCFWRWLLFVFMHDNKTPLGETGCLSIFLATALCHRHSTLASQTHEGFHQLWALPRHTTIFFECLGIQFFNLHTHVTYRMPCRAGDHPHSCLRKRGTSLGVVIILGICLSSHTYLNCTQFTIILDSYLYMSILQKFYLWWKEQQSN